MNKFSESGARRLSAQATSPFNRASAQPENDGEQRYGMSRLEYDTYVRDCQESEQFCTQAHTYFLNTPDVLQNFF